MENAWSALMDTILMAKIFVLRFQMNVENLTNKNKSVLNATMDMN